MSCGQRLTSAHAPETPGTRGHGSGGAAAASCSMRPGSWRALPLSAHGGAPPGRSLVVGGGGQDGHAKLAAGPPARAYLLPPWRVVSQRAPSERGPACGGLWSLEATATAGQPMGSSLSVVRTSLARLHQETDLLPRVHRYSRATVAAAQRRQRPDGVPGPQTRSCSGRCSGLWHIGRSRLPADATSKQSRRGRPCTGLPIAMPTRTPLRVRRAMLNAS